LKKFSFVFLLATITDEGIVEARPSEVFHMEYENYEVLAIVSK